MSLATPEKIRILQRKLYRKAKAEPAFRFYVLYDKIYREDILRHGYALARANAGAPGTDGMTFGGLARGTDLEDVPARSGAACDDTEAGWRRATARHSDVGCIMHLFNLGLGMVRQGGESLQPNPAVCDLSRR